MIYAIRNSCMLVEFSGNRAWKTARTNMLWGTLNSAQSLDRIPWQTAHQWVKDGGTHETALYTDMDGRVRRATDEGAGT